MHEIDEISMEPGGERPFFYQLDNVSLNTIGVDVGSATFHLMFSHVHLRREQNRLSSRFEVVSRETLWRSPIYLTAYRGVDIDAAEVARLVAEGHEAAGIPPSAVDSGAVILTGEALRRRNARALADAIADASGKFVCATAGHHLEAMLAAFGSGAVQAAKRADLRLLHVDIGGGTTKFARIDPSGVLQTAAVTVGGRVVAWDSDRTVLRISAGARPAAAAAGVHVALGTRLSESDAARLARELAGVLVSVIAGERSNSLERRLRLTPTLARGWTPQAVSFSGGVSEYLYGREGAGYGDLGPLLGAAVRDGLNESQIDLEFIDPGQGIRATVIGAAQSSVQLSGNTISVSHPEILPLRNVPVVHPRIDAAAPSSEQISSAIKRALDMHGLSASEPAALAFSWSGDPEYQRVRELASGIYAAMDGEGAAPVIVLIDDDIGASLGRLLREELVLTRPLICLDGLTLSPLDYVDVGQIMEPSGNLPVIIKSLLFGAPVSHRPSHNH